jgi:hypothetical protein
MGLFLKEVADFVGSGAGAGDAVDPATASATPSPPGVNVTGAALVLRGVTLAPTFVTCLLNMLEWGHHHVAPLLDVSISWSALSSLRDPLLAQFPSAWRPSYLLEIEDLERRFVIDVELEREVAVPELERIASATLAPWFTAINRGAYGDATFPPAECAAFLTEDAVEFSPGRILWFVGVFRCADGPAFDGLTNVLEKIHRTMAAIRRVAIE